MGLTYVCTPELTLTKPMTNKTFGKRPTLVNMLLLIILVAWAPLSLADQQTTTPSLKKALHETNSQIRKQYVDGRFGQIHTYRIDPRTPSTKKPLVCFHPTAASSDYFRDFMLEMGKDRTVIAIDTAGYGRSDAPPEPQSMAELAGSAADALDALGFGKAGLGSVDVIGYHTGVYIATELAIDRPDLVRRLILPGIPYYVSDELEENYRKYAKPTPLAEDGSSVLKVWEFWVQNRQPEVSLERGFEHFTDHMQSGTRSWWAYHGVFSYAAEKRLPLVTQPVLVPNTHGSLKENSRAAAKLFPNVEVLEIPELSHGIFDIGVSQLSDTSRSFLDKERTNQ